MKSVSFADRHIGISEQDIPVMLKKVGVNSMEELIDNTIPSGIRLKERLPLRPAMSEHEFAEHINKLAAKNTIFKSYIGQGWYDATLRLCRLPTARFLTRLQPRPKPPP